MTTTNVTTTTMEQLDRLALERRLSEVLELGMTALSESNSRWTAEDIFRIRSRAGVAAAELGEMGTAYDMLTAAHAWDPVDRRVSEHLAALLLARGERDFASEVFESLLRNHGDALAPFYRVEILRSLAEFYLANHRPDRARWKLELALAEEPEDLQTHKLLVDAESQLGDLNAATSHRAWLIRRETSATNRARLLADQARTLRRLGRLDEADAAQLEGERILAAERPARPTGSNDRATDGARATGARTAVSGGQPALRMLEAARQGRVTASVISVRASGAHAVAPTGRSAALTGASPASASPAARPESAAQRALDEVQELVHNPTIPMSVRDLPGFAVTSDEPVVAAEDGAAPDDAQGAREPETEDRLETLSPVFDDVESSEAELDATSGGYEPGDETLDDWHPMDDVADLEVDGLGELPDLDARLTADSAAVEEFAEPEVAPRSPADAQSGEAPGVVAPLAEDFEDASNNSAADGWDLEGPPVAETAGLSPAAEEPPIAATPAQSTLPMSRPEEGIAPPVNDPFLAASDEALDEGDLDGAAAELEAGLEAEPGRLDYFDRIAAIWSSAERWDTLHASYERMLERATAAGLPGALRARLLGSAASIAETKLHDPEMALQSLVAANDLPGDPAIWAREAELRERLGQPMPPERAWRRLRANPTDSLAVSAWAAALRESGADDHARVVHEALPLWGAVRDVDRAHVEATSRATPASPQGTLTADDRRALLRPPGRDPALDALFELAHGVLLDLYANDLPDFGLNARDALDLDDTMSVTRAVLEVSGCLGFSAPPRVFPFRGIEGVRNAFFRTPSLVVSPSVFAQRGMAELRFSVTQAMVLSEPTFFLAGLLDLSRLRTIARCLCWAIRPPRGITVTAEIQTVQSHLRLTLPSRRDELARVVEGIDESGLDTAVAEWQADVALEVACTGLLLANHIPSAMRLAAVDAPILSARATDEARTRLALFAVSPEHAQGRRLLGLG